MTLLASAWIVIEIVNVAWPRDASLPWYQNWGVIMVAAILAMCGVAAYAVAPRHEGRLGNVPSVGESGGGASSSGDISARTEGD